MSINSIKLLPRCVKLQIGKCIAFNFSVLTSQHYLKDTPMRHKQNTRCQSHPSRLYCESVKFNSAKLPLFEDLSKNARRPITSDEQNFFHRYLKSHPLYNNYVLEHDLTNTNEVLRNMSLHVDQFTKENLAVFMYYCANSRAIPGSDSVTNQLIAKLRIFVQHYSLEELAIISLGLFKTRTKLPDDLVHEFAHRLCDTTASTDSLVLGAMLKILKFSTSRASIRNINPAFQSAIAHSLEHFAVTMHNYSPYTVATLAQFYGRLRVMSDRFLTALREHIGNNRTVEWRVKDIQRLMYNYGHFRLTDRVVIDVLLRESKKIERREEFLKHPSHLISMLIGLSYINQYDADLTRLVFSRPYMTALLENEANDFSRDLRQLYHSVAIDRPTYLPSDYHTSAIREYEQRYSSRNRGNDRRNRTNDEHDGRVTTRERIVLDVANATMAAVGCEHVYVGCLLPHYTTQDVELCLDGDLRVIPRERWMPIKKGSPPVYMESQYRIAVVVHGPTSYFMYHRGHCKGRRLLGLHAMKTRHLAALGYFVVQIPFVELKESRDKVRYMGSKLWACLDGVVKPSSR